MLLKYIARHYPALVPIYSEIYNFKSRKYWKELDIEMRQLSEKLGLTYLVNDDSTHHPFDDPPVIVNYFYHEEIKRSTNTGKEKSTICDLFTNIPK